MFTARLNLGKQESRGPLALWWGFLRGKIPQMEEVGFEPTVPLLVRLFSKQMHSATLPLFQRNHFIFKNDKCKHNL